MRGRCACWSRAAGRAVISIRASRSPRRCRGDGRRGRVRRHVARPRDQAGPRGRLPAGAGEGERPQAHGRCAACCAGWRGCRARSSNRRRILRRHRPDVVLGVGGYASGPLVFAAALLGYPTAIQEQNSHPRLHQPRAGPAGAARVHRVRRRGGARSPAARSASLGNPVRRSFLERAAAGARPRPTTARRDRDPRRQPGLARGQRARLRDGARARRARAPAADHPPDRPRPARPRCRSTTRRSATRGGSRCARSSTTCPAVLAQGGGRASRARAR